MGWGTRGPGRDRPEFLAGESLIHRPQAPTTCPSTALWEGGLSEAVFPCMRACVGMRFCVCLHESPGSTWGLDCVWLYVSEHLLSLRMSLGGEYVNTHTHTHT